MILAARIYRRPRKRLKEESRYVEEKRMELPDNITLFPVQSCQPYFSKDIGMVVRNVIYYKRTGL
jgi:hypothetical protein